MTKREAFFDNYKALLIICVVIAHFLNHFKPEFPIARVVRIYIYFFHVPAFAFISGHFARKKDLKILSKQFIFPFILFQLVYYGMYQLIDHNVHFSLTSPYFTLWYIVALFFWRIAFNYLEHIRFLLPISIGLALCIGFLPDRFDYFSIYRIVSFFPFFVMGNRFEKESFMELKNRYLTRMISCVFLFILFMFVMEHYKSIDLDMLNHQDSYENLGVGTKGIIQNIMILLTSALSIYGIGFLVPLKANLFTFVGKNTMSIYLLHGLIYKYISLGTDYLDYVDSELDLLLYICSLIGMVCILSKVPLNRYMNNLYDILKLPYTKIKALTI